MRQCLVALGAAAAACSFAPAHANLLANGSFEAVAVTEADTCGSFPWCLRSPDSTPGWQQALNGVDLVNAASGRLRPVLGAAAEGVNFLDLNRPGAFVGVSQVVGVTPGESYTLTLQSVAWSAAAIGGSVTYALFDGVSSVVLAEATFDDNFGFNTWFEVSLNATATSSLLGVRIAKANPVAGLGVDNVVLVATPVPEPAAAALLLAGLAGLSAAARRRARPAR